MQNRINGTLVVLIATCLAACASPRASRVTTAELPAAVRATVDQAVAGGSVDKIDKETENGRIVYDVEATVAGKHVEYTITADGKIVGTETSIPYGDLPESVRTAAEQFFGTATGLEAVKGVEDGKTSYEVTGLKNGKRITAAYDAAGKFEGQE